MKVVFLDRDGVINKKAADHHYITRKEDFILNPGIFDVCKKLKGKGFRFIVITNQRGIARGLYTENDLHSIHAYMKDELEKRGVPLLDIFFCPHDINACDCRKPQDGMLRQALGLYPIDTERSLLVSDSLEDIEMGKKFGIGRNIFVSSDQPQEALPTIEQL